MKLKFILTLIFAVLFCSKVIASVGVASMSSVNNKNNPILSLRLLMLAEFAQQNKNYSIASYNYSLLAQQFHEAILAKRATIYAIKTGNLQTIADTAKLWAEIEPKNKYAQFLATTYLINSGKSKEALPYIENIFFVDSKNADTAIRAVYEGLSHSSAKHQLFDVIKQLAQTYPHNYQLSYATAWLGLKQQQLDIAWQQINSTLALKPDWSQAINLRAQILLAKQEPQLALSYIQRQIEMYPQDLNLKIYYANLLIETKQFAAAQKELEQISTSPQQRAAALIYMGRIAYLQQQFPQALSLLQQAVTTSEQNNNLTRILLGEIAQKINHIGEALGWYQSVTEGTYYVDAQIHVAMLYANQGNSSKALTILNEVPCVTPAEYKMVALAKIELLMKTEAYYSALNVVDTGLKALPSDLDLLLLGSQISKQIDNYPLAAIYLANAYQVNPTAETAAQYGTMLWQTGKQEEAEKIWQAALVKFPDDKILNETIKKFIPNN